MGEKLGDQENRFKESKGRAVKDIVQSASKGISMHGQLTPKENKSTLTK